MLSLEMLALLPATSEQQHLVHLLTHERVALPSELGDVWQLDVDTQERPMVFLLESDGALLVESLLTFTIFGDLDGNRWVVERQQNRLMGTLLQWVSAHQLGSARLQFGVPPSTFSFDVAVFQLPQPGGAVAWSLHSIFTELKLGSNRSSTGLAGRWCACNWEAWLRKLQVLDLQGSMTRSSRTTVLSSNVSISEAESRVLPWPSVTSSGLLALLLIWSKLERHDGGLREQCHREVCLSLLRHLLRLACWKPWVLTLYVDELVQCRWPAPPMGEHPVQVQVDQDGHINLDALLNVVSRMGGALASCWSCCLSANGTTSLQGLLEECALASKAQGSLFKQCVWAAGMQFDDCIQRVIEHPIMSLAIEFLLYTWSTEDPYQLERMIARYLKAIKEHFAAQQQFLSLTTDKSRVHGQALQNTLFVTPNNVACWGLPQVHGWTKRVSI